MSNGLLDSLVTPPRGVWLRITDSHDVHGGNDDGFNSTYSYLCRADDGWVLFEHEGPGTIVLVRTIGFNTELRIYDDEELIFSAPFNDLYSGKHPSAPAHLVANETIGHGSAWSYVPIRFHKRVRVVAPERLESYHFYNLWVHVYADDSDLDVPDTALLDTELWANPSRVPAFEPKDVCTGSGDIPPYSAVNILDRNTGGTIRWMRLHLPDRSPETLRNLRLRIWWDEQPIHAVYAPIGLFFGAGYPDTEQIAQSKPYRNVFEGTEMHIPLERTPPRSIPIGEGDDGWFYCRFPMPFARSVRAELINVGRKLVGNVRWEFVVDDDVPERFAYFHAYWRTENGTIDNRDYTLVDVRGHGRYVGCVMRMSSRVLSREWNHLVRHYLEGDAHFYIDDAKAFLCGSTGTEEYFNWGWYDVLPKDRVFTFPAHGYTEHSRDIDDHTTMYRFHLTDSVPFYRSLRFDIEHGPIGDTPSYYESVAFTYHNDEPVLVLSDVIAVSNSVRTTNVDGVLWEGHRTLVYEGNDQIIEQKHQAGDVPESWYEIAGIDDVGRVFKGSATYVATVHAENRGIRIRRRSDGEFPRGDRLDGERTRVVPEQCVSVLVDNEHVGEWRMPAHHARRTWLEDEFEIPAQFTAGKDRVTIRLQNKSEIGWNEFRYWIYSYTE